MEGAVNLTELTHEVAAMLKAEQNEENRFKSMDLCQRLIEECDQVGDQLLRETIRSWIGRIQERFGNQ